MPFLFQLLVGIALNILAAMLSPKPEQDKQEVKELEEQTAEAGKPVPVVFGTVRITSPNLLEFEKNGHRERKVPMPKTKK